MLFVCLFVSGVNIAGLMGDGGAGEVNGYCVYQLVFHTFNVHNVGLVCGIGLIGKYISTILKLTMCMQCDAGYG